jgi:outer membrane protein assembly factor BamE (lipoprotein component of BamABCDE complex)
MRKKCAQLLATISVTFFVFGCSHGEKSTAKIQVGMTKADVLESAGNPRHTGRQHGLDVWLYVDGDETSKTKTEVFFDEGKVKYVGAPDTYQPPAAAKAKPAGTFKPVGEK